MHAILAIGHGTPHSFTLYDAAIEEIVLLYVGFPQAQAEFHTSVMPAAI